MKYLFVSAEILDEIEKAGFANPTPIQRQAWPVLLQGLDLIGIAQVRYYKQLESYKLPCMYGPAASVMLADLVN